MIFYLISIGFVSILAQVVILRELSVAFFGVELIYLLALAVWLWWTAVGAMIGRQMRGSRAAGAAWLSAVFAFLLPADIALIRALRTVSGGVPGAYLPFPLQILDLAVVLLPVGLVLGALFQRVATSYVDEKRSLAGAYAFESAGGVLGGAAATILLSLGVQNLAIGVVCSGGAAATAVFAAARARSKGGRIAAAAAVLVIGLAVTSARLDRALTRINHPSLVASRDSPYGRLTVTRREDQFVVFENDAFAFETQSVGAEEFVHLAATSADTLRRVLILGGGVEGTAAEAAKYSPQRIDLVEINSVMVSLVEGYLPTARESLASKSVSLVRMDPRRFVTRAKPGYDLILVGAPDPTSGQTNRFYTREFFLQCRELLTPRGVFALRLRSSENVWTPFLTLRNTSIFRALEASFRDVVVLPGVTNIFLASDSPLDRDPVVLGRRLEGRGVSTRLVTPEYIEYLYTNDRFQEIARALRSARIGANTDATPVCYRYSGMIWLSMFFPSLIARGGDASKSSFHAMLWALAAVAAIVAGMCAGRRRARWRPMALAALAGLAGMLLESVLILHFQVTSGVLYRDLGLLLMAFMAGLAAGAGTAARIARRDHGNALGLSKTWGTRFSIGFVLLNLASAALLHFRVPLGMPAVWVLLLSDGFLVAALFAYASLSRAEDQRNLVTPLYASDILGGCVASVLGCIFLIPFFGMVPTAGVSAVLALLALLVL